VTKEQGGGGMQDAMRTNWVSKLLLKRSVCWMSKLSIVPSLPTYLHTKPLLFHRRLEGLRSLL
jgi:hypothetical protein